MGLFDMFRKKRPVEQEEKSLEERNREYLDARDQEVLRLRQAYDFTTVQGIMSIPVPCKEVNGNSPTGRVEYYLKDKCFSDYWNAGETELALACLRKAQELMYISDMIWKRSDFLRLVTHLYEVGKNEEADAELCRVNAFFENEKERSANLCMTQTLETAKFLDTDLVEVGSSGVCCEKCAKYRNRIYSISGKDKRFPKFPTDFHFNCGLRPFAYVWGVNEPSFSCKNIITYSNRPFKDDRTPEEKENYHKWREEMDSRELIEKQREANALDRAKNKRRDEAAFNWIQENLPSLCPKTLTGYQRMRTTNSTNYQRIVAKAAKLGKEL